MSLRMGLSAFPEQAVGSVFWGKSMWSHWLHMLSKLLLLLGKYQILCIFLCVYAMMWCLWKSEDIRSSEAGVPGTCEVLSVAAANWTLVLYESSRALHHKASSALHVTFRVCVYTDSDKVGVTLGDASTHLSIHFVCSGSVFSSSWGPILLVCPLHSPPNLFKRHVSTSDTNY